MRTIHAWKLSEICNQRVKWNGESTCFYVLGYLLTEINLHAERESSCGIMGW